jgi:HEAT repeat protein
VWSAAEALTSLEPEARRKGLDRLEEMHAARFSPLVAYLVTTRLTDPDMDIRGQAVRMLSAVLVPDKHGSLAPADVRRRVLAVMAQMRTRRIYALLELASRSPDCEAAVTSLLNACPYAGTHLADILTSKKTPLFIRREAASLIGRVGYLDAIPVLERLITRLASRLSGQQSMPFAPAGGYEETALLPDVQAALDRLRSS